jgi:hypothetical protein
MLLVLHRFRNLLFERQRPTVRLVTPLARLADQAEIVCRGFGLERLANAGQRFAQRHLGALSVATQHLDL